MSASSDDDAEHIGDDTDPDSKSGKPSSSSDDGSELDNGEVDRRFAELIADLDPRTDLAEEAERIEEDTDTRTVPVDRDAEEPTLLELWDAELPEDDEPEEQYQPPPPPPMPRPSLPVVVATLLIVGGLALLIRPGLLDVGDSLSRLGGLSGFIGGVLMLIWQLRDEPDEDDPDPGNGAVV